MAIIKTAGYRWSLDLVDWGTTGRGNKGRLLGYPRKKLEGGRGRPSPDQVHAKTLDVWNVEAVYSLFGDGRLIYVGEGILGDCLYRHHRTDEFVGRWDSFSWVSPWGIDSSAITPVLVGWDAARPVTFDGKDLIESIETVVIRLTEPDGNRQNPSSDKHITWLEQAIPTGHMTLEDKVDLLLEKLTKLERS